MSERTDSWVEEPLAGSEADGEGDESSPGAASDVPVDTEPATAGEDAPPAAILDDAAALAAERDEYLGALQRLKADFENYRKRVLRQQEEQSNRAALDLVGKLLPVLDTLDLAEAHLGTRDEPDAAHDAVALRQARGQLIDVLAKEGLERVDETEVAFDPVVHDAVAHAPADDDAVDGAVGGPVVDEVLRSGYRWRGQVLRPAMVRVRG